MKSVRFFSPFFPIRRKMRDLIKTCGITIHQNQISSSKIGEKCPEYPYKESKPSKKRKYQPPTDHSQRVYLGILDPLLPFSVFLWYQKRNDSDPGLCCVDLTVDGKRSPGWILKEGRKNGILIDSITKNSTTINYSFIAGRPL